jgi:hypothetical protein
MANPNDPNVLRDAEGFPFPDETAAADAAADAQRRARGIARGEPVVPSDLGEVPVGDEGLGRKVCRKGEAWSFDLNRCVPDTNPDNFDNPYFDFFDCEPSEANLEPPPECEVCIKEPLAFVPEWKRLANEEVFFDGQECLYSVVVHDIGLDTTRDRPSAYGLTERELIIEGDPDGFAKVRGLELIFEFLSKSEIVAAAEFVPRAGEKQSIFGQKYNREETDINMIDELLRLDDIVQAEYVISERPNIPTKYLISVPVKYVIDLPEVVVANVPEEIPTDEPLKVQFMGSDIKQKFSVMANSLNGAMMVYHRQYQIWIRQGGGVFKKTKYNADTQMFEPTEKNFRLDLKDHAEKMRDFLDALSEMLSYQNLIIPSSGMSLSLGQAPNVDKVIVNIENIDKAPGGKLRIKNVKANKKGCELVVFGEKRPATSYHFKKFEKQFRNSTLLGYIGQIPNMCIDSQARDPSEWFDWVVNHTYPPVEIKLGLNADDPAAESSLASCALGGLIADPVEELLSSLGEELGQVLKNKMGETLCLSPDELVQQMMDQRVATARAKAQAEAAREQYNIQKSKLHAAEDELKELNRQKKEGHGGHTLPQQIVDKESEIENLKKETDKAKKDLKASKVFLSKDLTERMRGGFKEEMTTFLAANPLFERLPKLLDSFAKKGKGEKKNLWRDVIKKLGPCGLLALLSEAMKCLLAGMNFDDDVKKKLVEAAFKAMDDAHIEKIFIGLPPDKQAEILAKVGEEFKGVKPPWEDPYREGTYSGSGWSKDDLRNDVLQEQGGKTTDEIRAEADEAGEKYNQVIKDLVDEGDIKEARKARRAATAEKLFSEDSGHILPGGGVQKYPKQGSLAMAVSDAQGAIFDAYKEAILELIGVDYLFDQLEKLPGAKLIATLIKDVPCKKPPPWRIDPPLGEFFKFEHLDPCDLRNTTGVWQMPPKLYVKKPVNLWYMAAYVWWVLKQIAEEMAFVAYILILKAILDMIVRLLCMALGAIGAALSELWNPGALRDFLMNELCGADARDEQLEESLANLMQNLSGPTSGPEGSCLETMDPSEIGDFIDSISATLLQNELLDLLNGSASPDVLEMVSQLAALSGSSCIAEIFSDPQNVADLFGNLGNLIDLSELENLVSQLEGDPTFVSPSICADPLAVESVDKIRCYLLSKKGLTEEECQEEIDKLKEQALDDLGTLADALHGNGPSTPPLDSSMPNLCGPEDGIYPYDSPAYLSATEALTDAMFEDLAIAHSRDLLGAAGYLNMILADTNGKGLKAHNFWVRYFGASEAKNLPWLGWYTDDAIKNRSMTKPMTARPINQHGRPLKGAAGDGKAILNNLPKFAGLGKVNISTGGFSNTVARHLQVILEGGGFVNFSTRIAPEGYETIAEYNEEIERIKIINDHRTNVIMDYVEAFIDEYDLDYDTDRTGKKRSTIAEQLRAAVRGEYGRLISPSAGPNTEHKKGTPMHHVLEILNGKQILTGVGHKFAKITNKKGVYRHLNDAWSKKNRRRAARTTRKMGRKTAADADLLLYRRTLDYEEYARPKGKKNQPAVPSDMIDTYFFDMETQDWTYDHGHYDPAESRKGPQDAVGPLWEQQLPGIYQIEMPEAQAADLVLEYEDYLNEYSLRIEYDPNPVDLDSILMSYPRPEATINGFRTIDYGGGDIEKFIGPADDSYTLSIYESYIPQSPTSNEMPPAMPIGSLNEPVVPGRTHKMKGNNLTDPEVVEFMEELDINNEIEKVLFGIDGFNIDDRFVGLSKQGIAFTTIIKNALLERGIGDDAAQQFAFLLRQTNNLIELNKIQRSGRFDEISEYYVKQLSIRISENKRSFKFGWKASDKPKVKILDFEKYGGTESAPPFYLEPPERDGWLGLLDAIVPEWDGCEPRRVDVVNFNALKELVDERNQSLPNDPRLDSDPLCITESPYDKILDKFSLASLEGIIAATIRIYVVEMFLQGMPVFSLFYTRIPENFDDVFLGYLVDKMEMGLIDEGTKFNLFKGQVIDKSYWYQFVEIAVQSFISRLPEEYNPAGNGEITDLTPLEIQAYKNIAAAVETFYHIEKYEYDPKGKGLAALTMNAINGQSLIKRIMESRPASVRAAKNAPAGQFGKAEAKLAKELAFETILDETMDDAKIILRRLVREELERLAEQFNETIKPSIWSMDALLLGNSDFIHGSLTDSKGNLRDPWPVARPREEPDAYILGNETIQLPGGFVLQKYIRIIEKEIPDERVGASTAIITSDGARARPRTDDLFDIVNIEDWDLYVKRLRDSGMRGKISEYWGDLTLGIDEDPESETFGQEIEIGESGWRFGVRVCYAVPPAPSTDDVTSRAAQAREAADPAGEAAARVERALEAKYGSTTRETELLLEIVSDPSITSNSIRQKAFSLESDGTILIPVAHGELEIPDQEFTNFDPATYDIDCLIAELIKDPAYKTLFNYCFPLKTFLSVLTMYCIKSFVPSIGSSDPTVGDNWVVPGGRAMSGFRRWDGKKEPFRRSTKKARKMFEVLYNSTTKDNSYRDREDAGEKQKWHEKLAPKWNYDLGLRWWMMPRQRSRPYDKDGNECE